MSGYSEGIRIEHIVMHDLADNGYEVTRAASSKGVADVIAIKAGQVLLVNVKRTYPPGPTERDELMRVAAMLPGVGVPLVAMKPKGHPLIYRHLWGHLFLEWTPWTPDEVTS